MGDSGSGKPSALGETVVGVSGAPRSVWLGLPVLRARATASNAESSLKLQGLRYRRTNKPNAPSSSRVELPAIHVSR